jgi:hypothetical protein
MKLSEHQSLDHILESAVVVSFLGEWSVFCVDGLYFVHILSAEPGPGKACGTVGGVPQPCTVLEGSSCLCHNHRFWTQCAQ